MMQLKEEVEAQFALGKQHMQQEDWHLLEMNMLDLLEEPADSIRGWLCDMHIARGQMDKAEEEGIKDRSNLRAAMSDVTPQQRREFMNWRNIHLKR